MVTIGKAEQFIETTSGCGPFQVVILIVVVASVMSTLSFSIIFMSFGNYNPGWRCLDNITSPNTSTTYNDPNGLDYTVGSCDVFKSCNHIEFNPESSTIVTEWGLLCDKAWMSSLTISIQMAGMVVFSYIAGQLADIFGRKKTLYSSIALCGTFQLISAFSVSWSMFVVLMFLICGLSGSNIVVVLLYVSEFMTIKWRAIIVSLPFWYTGGTIQAVSALITKDWRYVMVVGFVLHVLCFIPVFWVPESLRWHEVKHRPDGFNTVAQKIAMMNKTKDAPKLETEDLAADLVNNSKEEGGGIAHVKKYTIIDLFRHGYFLISVCLGLIVMVFSIIFFSMTFGTKALHGDFYINHIVSNVVGIPIFLLALIGVHYISRRRHTFFMLGFSAVCVFAATGLLLTDSDSAKSIGSTTLISIARVAIDSTWFSMYSRITEIYPTVVRGIGVGYISVTARTGGILAPFIIPEDNQRLYIFTIITGALILFCCILNVPLPETKGKPLKEDFEKRTEDVEMENV